MARRRFGRRRSATRRLSGRRARSRSRGSLGIGRSPIQIDSMIYGGLREKISTAIAPLTSKIPLGSLADEVGLGILNYFIAKKTGGMIRNIALKGLVIENARVGEAIVSGGLGILGTKGSVQVYQYG